MLHYTISYQALLHKFILSTLLSNCSPYDSIICISSSAKSALAKLLEHVALSFEAEFKVKLRYPGRLDVVPLGVDTDLFRPMVRQISRRQFHLPENAFIILCFGRLSPSDKMDLFPLLRVFSRLVRSRPSKNVRLVLAGGSSAQRGLYETNTYLAALKEEARALGIDKRLNILPSPLNPELLYSAADVFVSPSDNIQESFGMTIIEAMASGLPQVVTDWNGYRGSVVHGETGFLVPTYWGRCDTDICDISPMFRGDLEVDHVGLAQSLAMDMRKCTEYLTYLIDNEAVRRSMSRNSRRRALRYYSWPVVVRRYEELWCELGSIAAETGAAGERHSSYTRPAYVDCFGHYATRILDSTARITLSPDGVRCLVSESKIIPKKHVASAYGLLDESMLRRMLHACSGDRAGLDTRFSNEEEKATYETRTLQSLMEKVIVDGDEPDWFYRHVLWMIKYGLLDVIGPSSGQS